MNSYIGDEINLVVVICHRQPHCRCHWARLADWPRLLKVQPRDGGLPPQVAWLGAV